MDKLVATSCCDPVFAAHPKTKAVTAVMRRMGYDYRPFIDQNWSGWPSKLNWFIRAAEEFTDATHLLCIDGADVVALEPPDRVLEMWKEFNHPWVYAAEPNIWSPGSFKPEDYPTPPVTFRYLNAGICIGEREHMLKWFKEWTKNGPPICIRGDQDWVAERFLRHYPYAITIDVGCYLFQCMCGARVKPDRICTIEPGKVYNRITETYPALIHFNGGDDITADEEARKLWECLIT